MTKKKKIIIISVSVVLSLLLAAGTGAAIWYANSPFPTVMNLMTAAKNKDMDAMLDCIEPDKAEMLRRLMSYFGSEDNSAMLERFMPEGGALSGSENSSVRFSGYHQDSGTAYIELENTNNETGEVKTNKINFVKIEGKWYLAFSFGANSLKAR